MFIQRSKHLLISQWFPAKLMLDWGYKIMSEVFFFHLSFLFKVKMAYGQEYFTRRGTMQNIAKENREGTLVLQEDQVGPSFFQTFESRFGQSGSVGLPTVPFNNLSVKQRLICDTVQKHITKPMEAQFFQPLRLIIIGQAGCGKSQVLLHLKNILQARKAVGDFDFRVASFTGLSAHNIAGSTLHSCFRIPVYKSPSDWFGQIGRAVTEKIKNDFSNVAMILIDEYQMVSKNVFAYLDLFLRKCDPKRAAFPFAKRSIILAGDIWQFPPVADLSIFSPSLGKEESEREAEATKIYRREFRTVFVLEEYFRQDAEGEYFQFLCRLKKGECTVDDVEKLRQRLHVNLNETEKASFEDALAVFPTRALAHDYNMRKLFKDFAPADIKKIDSGRSSITLARGAKVVITRNLTVAGGVFNGSVAKVVDWVYENTMFASDQPKIEYVVVDVPTYDGDVLVQTKYGKGLPIFRCLESELCETSSTKYVKYKKFPLLLFSGSTGHKAIGLSLPKIVVNLDHEEMFPAWTFVQLSRIKDFSCVMFVDNSLSDDRLLTLRPKQKNFMKVVMREEERLRQIEMNSVF